MQLQKNIRRCDKFEHFNLPNLQTVLGYADFPQVADQYRQAGQTMFQDYTNAGKQFLCTDAGPRCDIFTAPVFDATDRTCRGVYNSMDSLCTEIGQNAYDWGSSQTFFPSSLKAPMRDMIVSQCRSVMPTADMMCGWIDPLRSQASNACQTNIRGGLGC